MRHLTSIGLGVVAVCWLLLALERPARAQGAWVDAPGSLTGGLNFSYAQSDKVIGDSKLEFPDSGTRTEEIMPRIEYVPVNHLAVGVQLPFDGLTYLGNKTEYVHRGGGAYDDGSTHYVATDFRADVRYQLLEDPFVFTPIIGVSVPVTAYETVGNTVAGRHLDQLIVGAAIGRMINNFYVHAVYTYSFVQRVDYSEATKRFNENHSDGSLRIGYRLLHDKLDINLEGDGRITHGGLDFDDSTNTKAEFLYHDAYLHEDILLVGPGLEYQLTDKLALDAYARIFVTGLNTQNASVFGLNVTWNILTGD